MNEHAGASCALSVLIVGVFAVLLHDEGRAPTRPEPAAPAVAPEAPRPPAPEPEPAAPPPRRETVLVAPPPAAPSRPAPRTVEPARNPVVAVDRPRPPKPVGRPRPRADFTVVEPGESLRDVAARVYGSARSAEALWKANRDQLASLDAPLARGTLLRTP